MQSKILLIYTSEFGIKRQTDTWEIGVWFSWDFKLSRNWIIHVRIKRKVPVFQLAKFQNFAVLEQKFQTCFCVRNAKTDAQFQSKQRQNFLTYSNHVGTTLTRRILTCCSPGTRFLCWRLYPHGSKEFFCLNFLWIVQDFELCSSFLRYGDLRKMFLEFHFVSIYFPFEWAGMTAHCSTLYSQLLKPWHTLRNSLRRTKIVPKCSEGCYSVHCKRKTKTN